MRGKAAELYQWGMDNGDHPRLCGEKGAAESICTTCLGSPPPMRGKALCLSALMQPERITPAYAGKSGTIPRCAHRKRDHPRLCGEKYGPAHSWAGGAGSPPPMRGKGPEVVSLFYGREDHPRLCGEKSEKVVTELHRAGSPPPMRGKGKNLNPKKQRTRITPAYAGKRESD